MQKFSGWILAFALAASSIPCAGNIVINELMYHPASDTGEEEYLELYNNSGEQVDLGGWAFTAGIDYVFPSGTLMPPDAYLVIARSPAAFAGRYPDVTGTVLGPYPNRLSNGGEKVNLRDSQGLLMDTVTYADLPPWPTAADGQGPSAELRHPDLDNDWGESWVAGATGGSPGVVNSVYEATPAPQVRLLRHEPAVPAPTQAVAVVAQVTSLQDVSRVLLFSSTSNQLGEILPGEPWRFFRGRSEPSGGTLTWTAPEFDDGAWEEGPSGIGYGDGDDATVLEDMQGNYLSVYLRKSFAVADAAEVRHLAFTADWDDGFILYLNGAEVLRRGMGEPGEWFGYDRPASSDHEADAGIHRYVVRTFDLASHRDLLSDGTNVLAVQCHNFSIDSSDLTFIPQLEWAFQTPFAPVEMFDDGLHADGPAADGVFGATLPAAPQDTIVEFYAVAEDSAGRQATGPRSAPAANGLYQVDGRAFGGSLPHYRVVMARGDFIELLARSVQSDELLNCTFVDGPSVYYRRGIRLRGSSARRLDPRSYRIEFPASEPFGLTTELNLNGYQVPRQLFAWDLWHRSGLPHPAYALVGLTLENEHFPNYLQIESVDDDFLSRQFPGDDDGNLYRGLHSSTVEADLEYLGPDPEAYRSVYEKINNEPEDDFSDIIHLTDVFSNASDAEFPARIAQAIDVPEWIAYFALQAVSGNTEGGIHRAKGEDYFLYRRPSDGRFLILPWDADQSFSADDETVFSQELPSVVRLIQNPAFVRSYYQAIEGLLGGAFTLRAMRRSLEAYRDVVAQDDRDDIVDFVGDRRLSILEEVPQKLLYDGGTSPGDEACRRFAFASSLATVRGRSNAARTVGVRIGGAAAAWDSRGATWEAELSLVPGRNDVLVEALDEGGAVFDTLLLPLFLYYGTVPVPATLTQDQTWNVTSSPYYVAGTVSVPPGVRLRVEPGVTVFLDQGASLLVEGGLEAMGSGASPIRLLPWRCEAWGAIGAVRAEAPLRLNWCEFQQPSEATAGAYFLKAAVTLVGTTAEMDHCAFRNCAKGIDADGGSLLAFRNGSLENVQEAFHAYHSTLWIEDSRVVDVRTYADAVDFDGDSEPPSRVSRCIFDGGQIDDGIDTSRTTVLIEDNVFRGFDADNGKALSLEGPSTPIVRGNVIYGNDVGIAIKDSCSPVMEHNTIVDNGVGVDSYEKLPRRGGGSGSLRSSIVWGNDTPLRFDFFTRTDATSELEVTYSDVQGGLPPPGQGNLSADPLFANLWTRDYHLRPGSPCIGAAHDGTDMGAFYAGGTETPTPTPTFTPALAPTATATPSPSRTPGPSSTPTPTPSPTSTPPPGLLRWEALFDLSSRWGKTSNLGPYDLEPDGTLDAKDLLALMRSW